MTAQKPSHRAEATALALIVGTLIAAISVAQYQAHNGPARSALSDEAAPMGASAESTGSEGGTLWLPTVPEADRQPVDNTKILNREATIPPQCYTKTDGRFNPCFTCHQSYREKQAKRLNQTADGHLQGSYAFSDIGTENHYKNLFVDRREWMKQVSDEQILAWVNQENYTRLASRLEEAGYQGFIPDLTNYQLGAEAFDESGFARDGSGWVAFNYKPFPGTFWPTNGATDDVLIRLPAKFRTREGHESRAVYLANLSLVELAIKDEEWVSIPRTSEEELGVDLDGDGKLTWTQKLVRQANYVGDAKDVPVTFQQVPAGTELMHSVRYLGVRGDRIVIPPRMKELRYMRKLSVLSRDTIAGRYAKERKAKLMGELPKPNRLGDGGLDNGLGWQIKGFIEDYDGELRPQSYEEDLFCVGCHKGIGTTIDSTFSLARKVPGARGWGYINLEEQTDAPSRGTEEGEVLSYLRRVGGGSEFRENAEMRARWFKSDGSVDEQKVRKASLAELISPSRERALDLNRAYTHIVRHQSYIFGRDATTVPAKNVLEQVDAKSEPLRSEHRFLGWDIRLQWDLEELPPI